MKINQSSTNFKHQPAFINTLKSLKTIVVLAAMLFSANSMKAQTEKELIDFLHSGTVTTKNSVTKVPIEIWNDLILMHVKVNGHETTLMWDNGFSFSGIDNSLVETYKFRPYSGSATGTDGNNVTVNVNFLVCPEIEINGISITDTPFIKLDFRTMTMTKDLKIEGIIGASVINKLNWKFDFDNNFVEISQKPFTVNTTDVVLPYKIIETNNNHIMPITFNGIKTDCLVDYGYNSDVIEINTANAKFFSKANATKTFGVSSVSVSGLAPTDTIYTIKDNFSWELSDKKLNINPKIAFAKASSNVIIGNKIFRNAYNVVINTSGNTVYALSARKKITPAVANDKSYGYRLHNVNGVFKVLSIYANANTAANTIKLQDEVVSINGKTPADFEDNYAIKVYQQNLLDNQQKMTLKFKNGKEITLTPQPNTEYPFKNEKELW